MVEKEKKSRGRRGKNEESLQVTKFKPAQTLSRWLFSPLSHFELGDDDGTQNWPKSGKKKVKRERFLEREENVMSVEVKRRWILSHVCSLCNRINSLFPSLHKSESFSHFSGHFTIPMFCSDDISSQFFSHSFASFLPFLSSLVPPPPKHGSWIEKRNGSWERERKRKKRVRGRRGSEKREQTTSSFCLLFTSLLSFLEERKRRMIWSGIQWLAH